MVERYLNQMEEFTIHTNKTDKSKINKIEYFELIMAILNAIIIIYLFTFARNITIISILFASIFIGVLYGGLIITFLKRNPFYTYFCYGIMFCGIIGNIFEVFLSPLLTLIFIPQIYYVYGKIADLHMDPYDYFFKGKSQNQMLAEKQRGEIERKQRREEKRKYNGNLIEYLSLCCSIGLFLTMIFSA